jgi:CheY-like chemotaxis protein
VLIVDDDPGVVAILRHGMEGAGLEVITASDGASALRQLVEHLLGLDLLVTDLEMPGLDGPSLVRIIRAEGGERELPIMILASSIGGRDRELLVRLGVSAVLEKRGGSERAVHAALQLATASRDRRLGALDVPEPDLVALGSVALVRQPRTR